MSKKNYRRSAAPYVKGYSEAGASVTRRALKGFTPDSGSPNEDINRNNATLRQRSRMLYMASPVATSAINTNRTKAVGTGLTLKATVDRDLLGLSPEAAKEWQHKAEMEFRLWGGKKQNCDALGLNNFMALQQLALKSWLMSGDVFVLVKRYPATPLNPYSMRLHVIEADRVSTPTDFSGGYTYGGFVDAVVPDGRPGAGHRVFDGVEVDKNGRVVAYYISNTYPHQITTEKQEWTRVPAYGERTGLPNILHIMDSERPDQYRGVPYLAQVIEPLLQLRRYTESELMAALVQSFFTAWIETETDPSGTPFNEVGTGDIAGVPTASPDGAGASNISDDPNEYEMGPGNAIAQAYQEQLTEIYSKNADVLIEAEKNKIGLRDAEGKLAVAQKAQNDEFERQNRLYQEANQKVQEYYEETGLVTDANMWLGETTDELNWKLEQNAQAVMEAQDAVDAYQKAIDKDNDALQAAQDEIALAEEAVQNLTTATEDSTTATEDASRGYGELNTEISSVKERVEALQQAYQEAYKAAAESVQGQYALWQQADSIVATSASSINSNLQGQITHWQTYNDNLASLRDRAGDIEGLTEMIGSFADGSSDSVNAVAGMAAASDEELAAMVESWNKLREEQNKAAEDIADFRTGFSETMDAISGDLEATIDDMDLGTEAAEAGRATIQGFIDGATGMLPTVQSAYSQLGYAALAALSRNVQNNNSVASSRRMSGFSRYASGTTSAETGLALVGEEGPEFVMMHGGEAVLNAADTHSAIEAMTSTSDSSVPVQVNITVEGDVNDGVMERLETYGEEFAAQVRAVIREDNINAQRGAYR